MEGKTTQEILNILKTEPTTLWIYESELKKEDGTYVKMILYDKVIDMTKYKILETRTYPKKNDGKYYTHNEVFNHVINRIVETEIPDFVRFLDELY